MGRFCLFAFTGLTDRFRHARGFFTTQHVLSRSSDQKKNVLILENFLYDEEQKQFRNKKLWEVFLTFELKSKEKSENSSSRRHWWSV